jgi:hypothetical protein
MKSELWIHEKHLLFRRSLKIDHREKKKRTNETDANIFGENDFHTLETFV